MIDYWASLTNIMYYPQVSMDSKRIVPLTDISDKITKSADKHSFSAGIFL